MRRSLFLLFSMLLTKSSAQELFVFSELPLVPSKSAQQLGCDSIESMRDIAPLSPAVEQGGGFTLVLAVTDQPGKPFVLDTGQYPAGLFPLRLHRFLDGSEDTTSPVTVPIQFQGRIPESRKCAFFLLEVEVPANAPVGRMKLEPAVWFPNLGGENFWIRYPMEVRVVPPTHPVAQCPPHSNKLDNILFAGIGRLLGTCVDDSGRSTIVTRVRELRRQLGKKQ